MYNEKTISINLNNTTRKIKLLCKILNFLFSNNALNKKHKNTRFKSTLQAVTKFILFYAIKVVFFGQAIAQIQCSVSPKMYVNRYD